MIASEKSHQNLSDYNQYLFEFFFEIQIILFLIMLTRFSERIFDPMRYTGLVDIGMINLSLIYKKFVMVNDSRRLNNKTIELNFGFNLIDGSRVVLHGK